MSRFQNQRKRYPKLARRAQRQGRISTGPDRRAAQRSIRHTRQVANRQLGTIHRQGRGAARSYIRTGNREADFERGLAGNLKGVATPGLVRRQLAQGARQVEAYGRGQATIARKAASQAARGVKQAKREDIYQTQESVRGIQHQATAAALADLVAQRRQTQRDAAQQQQQDLLDKLKAQRGRQRDRFQEAYGAVGDLLETDPVPPKDAKEWNQFARVLQQKNPLMSPRAIQDAIDHYRTTQLRQRGPDVLSYWTRLLGLR